jgi:uncharacterized membrane protein
MPNNDVTWQLHPFGLVKILLFKYFYTVCAHLLSIVIGEFLYKYYVDPILHGEAYTVVDTLTYAAILIVSVYLVYRWLRREQIAINHDFILALIPYVVLGGLLRVVEDAGLLPYPYHVILVTPIIFLVLFACTIAALVVARFLASRGAISDWVRGFRNAGIGASILVGFILAVYGFTTTTIALDVLVIILSMAFISSWGLYALLFHLFRWEYVTDVLYRILIFGHMLDASATSYGIDLHPLRYVEQHVVGSTLIGATGTAFVMFPLKLVVIIPAIYTLNLYKKEGNEELWHLILLAMIMVGLAPGIRDMVRMVLYV